MDWKATISVTVEAATYGVLNASDTSAKADAASRNRQLGYDIYFYSSGVVIPIGLVCNMFSVVVFVGTPALRRTSTAQLLIALAVVDTLVLVGDLLRWMTMPNHLRVYRTGLKFIHTSNTGCKLMNYLRYRYVTTTWFGQRTKLF